MSTEIELLGKENTDGISWSLLNTRCKSMPNLKPIANMVYKNKCDLSVGQSYTLQCKNIGDGWKTNFIVIENSDYCKHARDTAFFNITITGQA